MKIGIVLANTPVYSETFFISKIKGLQKAGRNVVLLVNNNTNNFDICEVRTQDKLSLSYVFRGLLKLILNTVIKPKRIIKFIKFEKNDGLSFLSIIKKVLLNQHILFNNLDWLHFGFATMAIGRENIAKTIGAKMAVSIRGFDIGIYPLKDPDCYKKVWKNIDKLHYISDDLLQLAINNGFNNMIAHQKITPAIDVELFLKKNITKQTTDVFQILTVGRLHWKKGYNEMIMALKIIKDKGISFHYNIVGDGKDEEKLKYLVYELGLTSEVSFLGKLEQSKIIQLMETSQIYMQYSIQEGFCNAVLEAQSMGMLSIVSNAEGLSENILDIETGWVVPKYNTELLAKKILDVVNLPEEEKNKMRNQAIDRVKNNFNVEKQQREFVTFYQN